MNIKQKVIALIIALGVTLGVGAGIATPVIAAECAGVQTSIIACDQKGGDKASPRETGVWGLLLLGLNILTAGVGIAAVGGIGYASFLYASASDRSAQVQQAKDIIRDVVIGLAAYAGMYLLLNFLIPGGIFS